MGTLAATTITHPNLQLYCQRSICIVGNVGGRFWQGGRMCGLKKRRHLWFCCIDFDFFVFNCPSGVWQCYRSARLNRWSSLLFRCQAESSASHVVQILENTSGIRCPRASSLLTSPPAGLRLISSQFQSCQPADLCSSPVNNRETPSNVASKLLKGAMHCGWIPVNARCVKILVVWIW